jgi:predicted Fe-Mo cluster-binding NifX family protein
VHEHFGSAPIFTIFETDTKALEVVENPNNKHLHGTCQPLNALNGTDVDVVVKGDTVGEVILNYGSGDLEEITVSNACAQHHCH